jgi:hydrogenase-4 component F
MAILSLIYLTITVLLAASILLIRKNLWMHIAIITFGINQLLFTIFCFINSNIPFLEYFNADHIALLMLAILIIIVFTTIFHSIIFLKKDKPWTIAIYYISLMFLIVAITGVYLTNNLLFLWIFVEATTLSLAPLIYHNRTTKALEATWKYIFVCSVGIAIAYLGILFLSTTNTTVRGVHLTFDNFGEYLQNVNPVYLKIAFLFIIIGFGAKIGLFPMHTVGIDAKSVAPSPIAALMSTVLANAGFVALFRVWKAIAYTPIHYFANNILILTGILSLIIAAGYMLKATHTKRILAYSTLEHMGIVTIALGIGGYAYYALFLHIVLHSFLKAGLFYQIGQAYKGLGTHEVKESGNYFKIFPLGAILLLIGVLLITAIPPSGMFITELNIFKQIALNGNWTILIIMIILLCSIIYGLITRVLYINFLKPVIEINNVPKQEINKSETITQILLYTLIIIACFYQPDALKNIINEIIKSLP